MPTGASAWMLLSREEASETLRPLPKYRNRAMLIDVTHVDLHTGVRIKTGSANRDGAAAL